MIRPQTLQYKIELEQKQTIAWDYLFDDITTELGYGGGGGGGKSWLGAGEFLIFMCTNYPDTRWLLGRKELKNLKRTSLITFFKVANAHGLKQKIHYTYNQNDSIIKFWNGSEIILYDLKANPSDPLFLELGGLELTGAVVEESNEVSVMAINILNTRIGRWNNEKYNIKPILLETFNPDKGHVYHRYWKPFKSDSLPAFRKFVRALPTDNPHLPASYIEKLKNGDKITRERLLFGNFDYEDDPTALMDIDALSDLFSNHIDIGEGKYMTIDVARFGMDKTVIKCWKGLQVYRIVTIPKCTLKELVERAEGIREEEQIPLSCVIADEDGVGGGVVDFMGCKGFVGNSSPFKVIDEITGLEKDSNHQNLRSQCYFMLADKVNKREMRIVSDDDAVTQIIIEELEQIKRKDADKDGKLKIVSKDDIKEKLGRSPDYADTLMMRMYFEVAKEAEPNVTWL